jgi:hypothetical protein
LNNAAKTLEMLPDETPNAWVAQYGLVDSIRILIICSWAFDRHIVNVWDCKVGNLWAKNMSDVVMKNGN